MITAIAHKGEKTFYVTAWIDDRNVPKVRWEYLPLNAYTKEGTPIDFLDSGISCPEVHEYFNNHVIEAGYNDD